ncbi:MAG: sensor domain-containing phosphodiesterase [Acidimicrobiales bacterium]
MLELHEDLRQLLDPMLLIQRVADQAVDFVDGARGTLIGLTDETGDVLFVCGSGICRPWVGMHLPADRSLSGLCIRENRIQVSAETETDERVDVEACRLVNARSMVCVPIRRADRCVGAVTVMSTLPYSFTDDDVRLLSEITDFASAVVVASAELSESARRLLATVSEGNLAASGTAESTQQSHRVASFVGNVLSPVAQRHRRERSVIESLVERRAIEMYYQPIVGLLDHKVYGVEVLARIWEEPYRPPDYWFALAESAGLGLEMEMLAVELAVASMGSLAPHLRMSVNVGPDTMLSPQLHAAVTGAVDPERIVVELTEHVGVVDYAALVSAQELLGRSGVTVAVDDAGTGISSLSHILRLHPDYIKLDRDLITGIGHDPARHALVESMVAFAAGIGSLLIAEGIETQDELDVLTSLGVAMGQGYLLGMPVPLHELPVDLLA